jgi:hypothetical protein
LVPVNVEECSVIKKRGQSHDWDATTFDGSGVFWLTRALVEAAPASGLALPLLHFFPKPWRSSLTL